MFAAMRPRWGWLSLIVVAGTLLTWSDAVSPVRQAAAQDDAAPAADAPAAEGGEGAGAVAHTQGDNTIVWFFKTIGLIGIGILLLSVYFVSMVGRLFVQLREDLAAPPELSAQLDTMLEQRQFKEIYALVKDDDSFLGRILAAGIAELPNGLVDAREAMALVAESVQSEMEKRISMLAVLGTLGPMIGLLGTLKGMIGSFAAISRSDQQLKASEVAGHISEALLVTFLGVGLSVPAIFFYAVFRNRISAIMSSVTLQADYFIRHFAHAARNKGGAAPAAAKARA